ncbi:MAG: phosphotransferase [Cardiobacteriaceae bacterium]|nr:phosphotransferase [Cardiobacteriaceae bacterium]
MLDQKTWGFIYESFPQVSNIKRLVGDAGTRKYYRLEIDETETVILMDGRAQPESVQKFFELTVMLSERELPVAEIYAQSEDGESLLLEDLGDVAVYEALSKNSASLMPEILDLLAKWQTKTADMQPFIAPYSRDILREEFSRADNWFFPYLLAKPLSVSERGYFQRDCDSLVNIINNQPKVLVYRDFHSKNLMMTRDKRIVFIDYQDALWGSAAYDLISITRDCYISYPKTTRDAWEDDFRRRNYPHLSHNAWKNICNACALQRHMKVLGLFVRIAKQDRKPRYLNHLPLVWDYVLEESAALEATVPFLASKCRELDGVVRKALERIV